MDTNDANVYITHHIIQQDPATSQVVFMTVNSDVETLCQPNFLSNDNPATGGAYEPAFVQEVKIIAFDDGRMFLTNGDTVFNAVEPQLIAQEVICDNISALESINISEDVDSKTGLLCSNVDQSASAVNTIQEPCENIKYNSQKSRFIAEQKKSYKCLFDGCGKSYSSSHHLNVHMRNHMESKPYSCTVEGCEKTFATNYSLKAHSRIHTGEKPYPCPDCDKCFKTSGDLQKHYRTHTGEKPFLCPVMGCGKSFTTSNIRKVHVRSHTGERPYVCDYPNCGKAFASSTNFKNHSRIHSGEKPYACPVDGCERRFTEYSSLYKHSVAHQINRPYRCNYCTQKFKSESALNLHKRVKHNVVISADGSEIVVEIC